MVVSCVPPTGDLACNPGMCSDWESNRRSFGSQASTQFTEPQQPRPIDSTLHLEERKRYQERKPARDMVRIVIYTLVLEVKSNLRSAMYLVNRTLVRPNSGQSPLSAASLSLGLLTETQYLEKKCPCVP